MKKILLNKHLVLYVIFLIGFSVLLSKVPYASWFEPLLAWAQDNLFLFMLILILIKILGIVWPPIPAGVFTLSAIPLVGWPLAYMADLIGLMIGGMIAYMLAGKYGLKLLRRLFGQNVGQRIEGLKIKEGKEIEAIFMVRLISAGVILELVCYAAGLLKINWKKYLLGLFLSHLIIGVPTFLLANSIITPGRQWMSVFLLIIAIPVLLKFNNRYIEKN